MTDRQTKIPGPDHPITITPTHGHVVAKLHGQTVADTRRALTLKEASYPPVQYIPLADVDPELLASSNHTTWCPYKGEASYYSLPAGGDRSVNAVWSYRTPHEAVAEIKDHVAFYPDRIDSIEIQPL
jgi:uncharacterized protein (DUF427 family)